MFISYGTLCGVRSPGGLLFMLDGNLKMLKVKNNQMQCLFHKGVYAGPTLAELLFRFDDYLVTVKNHQWRQSLSGLRIDSVQLRQKSFWIQQYSCSYVAGHLQRRGGYFYTHTGAKIPRPVFGYSDVNYKRAWVGDPLGYGGPMGEYFVYGVRQGDILVPWHCRYVKYLAPVIRNHILFLLLVARRCLLYKYIAPSLWKNYIIPTVVWPHTDDFTGSYFAFV